MLANNEQGTDTAAVGTVIVDTLVNAPVLEVWQALTDPTVICRWFGELTGELRLGGNARFEFGDGDFFVLEDVQLNPPHHLQYAWRFLGTGPLDTITWDIVPQGSVSLVRVTDSELDRSREEALSLREGWLDFTQRLERFLSTGQSSRYDWCREFDGSIELECTQDVVWRKLFSPEGQTQWLPLDGIALEDRVHFLAADGTEASLFQITDVKWNPPSKVQFHLFHPDWLHATRCSLELSPRNERTMLSIHHDGWEAISPHDEKQQQQRKRFSALWVTALKRAHQLID
jgi:uncharacterized protein YndB with AHSA1/START domain